MPQKKTASCRDKRRKPNQTIYESDPIPDRTFISAALRMTLAILSKKTTRSDRAGP